MTLTMSLPGSRSSARSSQSRAAASDDFDPNLAFDIALSDIDYEGIARHRAAELAQIQEQQALLQAKEAARLASIEEERRQYDEQLRRNRELEEKWAQERRAKEEELARQREEEARLLPERMQQIKAAEPYAPGNHWPRDLSAREMYVDASKYNQRRSGLTPKSFFLPDPFQAAEPAARAAESAFDSYFDQGHEHMRQISQYSGKLDAVPPVFRLEDEDTQYAGAAGALYKDLCFDLFHALKDGLYEYDSNMLKNLRNAFTKRLRTYYQNILWGHYEYVNILDGWNHLFRLMLILKPEYSRDNKAEIEEFLRAIRKVTDMFDTTERRVKGVDVRKLVNPSLPNSAEIAREIHHVQSQVATPTTSETTVLFNTLLDRREEILKFSRAYYLLNESREVQAMRAHTEKIIEMSAKYFVEHSENPEVRLLRSIAFGHRPLKVNEELKLNWIDAIKKLPENCVSHNSPLWKDAVYFAGVHDTGIISKSYAVNRPRSAHLRYF